METFRLTRRGSTLAVIAAWTALVTASPANAAGMKPRCEWEMAHGQGIVRQTWLLDLASGHEQKPADLWFNMLDSHHAVLQAVTPARLKIDWTSGELGSGIGDCDTVLSQGGDDRPNMLFLPGTSGGAPDMVIAQNRFRIYCVRTRTGDVAAVTVAGFSGDPSKGDVVIRLVWNRRFPKNGSSCPAPQ